MENCPCGKLIAFENCCEPLHKGTRKAETAEEVMRSRYTAYVVADIDYLVATTLPAERPFYSRKGMLQWAKENKWLKLEILESRENYVEFKAYFQAQQKSVIEIHHEKSVFQHLDGIIYYVEAI